MEIKISRISASHFLAFLTSLVRPMPSQRKNRHCIVGVQKMHKTWLELRYSTPPEPVTRGHRVQVFSRRPDPSCFFWKSEAWSCFCSCIHFPLLWARHGDKRTLPSFASSGSFAVRPESGCGTRAPRFWQAKRFSFFLESRFTVISRY